MTEPWRPRVTVAAVIRCGERFLLVEEWVDGALRLNQPAGHLEPDEGLTEAMSREVLEETGYHVEPEGIIAIYRWRHPGKDLTFLRTTFAARCVTHHPERSLDPDIHRPIWLTAEEIAAEHERLRSPMVLRSVEDYLRGALYPLGLLQDLP
ncbi:NUDIX hydrolase [Arhodomonas sp. SL1]|uniref:NUDIX hydrolase n=1 Tax=Arhodomonas sp. SL1 TaxID=3425691 RepID=UPI003F8819D2